MKFLFQFSIKFYSPINCIYFSAFTIGIITRGYFLYSLDPPLYLAPSPASTPFRLQACRWYPIPINFNDERGQFNTSWTHCSKVVGNKSYALVTEKCMTQISAGVICYTPACLSARLPSLRYIRAHMRTRIHTHVVCIAVRERDIVLMRDTTSPLVIWSMGTQFLLLFFISFTVYLFLY